MKTLCTIILFAPILLFAQTIEDIETPVNPDFLIWQQEHLLNNIDNGDIPYLVNPSFDAYYEIMDNKKSFDLVYDLRIEGLVTPPKSQGSCGACWTFASLGSIESFLLKNSWGTYDFSEQHMRTCHGFIPDAVDLACTGGNPKKAAAYLSRRNGPVDESSAMYNTSVSALCNTTLDPIISVEELILFSNDEATVKQAIIDYGALYTNMRWEDPSYNSVDYTYYYDGSESTTHAVLLCGWNDNKVTAGGTGAWIIKNSWGNTWGESGYFYISYNDTKALSTVAAFPSVDQIYSDEVLYMYDELGWISSTGYSTETAFGLTKFITTSKQEIHSVGIYVNTALTTVNVTIYDSKSGNTLSGILGSTATAQFDFPGYYKIDVLSPFILNSGEDFYIKVEYNTPGYTYPIPFEKFMTDYADPLIEQDVCWISSSGTSWTLMGSTVAGKERDLCIRAYATKITTNINDNINNSNPIIYPNPCSDIVNVDIKDLKGVKVYGIDGKILKEADSNSDLIQLDVSDLPKGIYLLKITTSNEHLIEKLAVK